MRQQPAERNLRTPKEARRERVLRGRVALASGVRHSAPPPKPTSLVTFLFGDKKVTLRRHERILRCFVPCNISQIVTRPCKSVFLIVTSW